MRIVVLAALALIAGCAAPVEPTVGDLVTPGGIEVYTNGHTVDASALDAAFAEQALCFGYEGADRPTVRIVEPHRYNGRCGIFRANGIEVYGIGGAYVVEMPPDCCAAPHEFAHFISWRVRGTFGVNGGECAL